MVGELIPTRIDPATADTGFWTRFHELRRLEESELRPDDPPEPEVNVELRMKKPDPSDLHDFYEMSRDGMMVSSFSGETVAPENPEYATNKHLYWAYGFVRPEARRKGLAKLWLRVLVQLMEEHGCTIAGMNADHEEGHAFLRWLGADPKLTEVESRARFSEIDWPLLERWADEGVKRNPQTRLEVYDGALPDELLVDFAAQRTVMLNTMPLEGLELGEIVSTPERFRDFYEKAAVTGEVPHAVFTREPDGVISGMTDVVWAPHRPGLIYQDFTGVLPAERGRGIGKWIKAAMLLRLRERYPGAEWIATENAHSNDPMLSINRRIGFKPYRTAVEYQIPLEKLKTRISG